MSINSSNKVVKNNPKPNWLKVRLPSGESFVDMKRLLRKNKLHTVCEEAGCPNLGECWGLGTATFMLLGDVCTRHCHFCQVKSGNPRGFLDLIEPLNIADAVKHLKLKYIVLTSVDRDDLLDGGAEHFAKTIKAIKNIDTKIVVESLIPDFAGNIDSLKMVVDSHPDVIGHNLETVRSLTPKVRDRRANYSQSLNVLIHIKKLDPKIFTKSSLLLGIGEKEEEVIVTMHDLRNGKVDFITLGQYLQPSLRNLKVVEYIKPERFDYLKKIGEDMGFLHVASSPLVRSSYRSSEYFIENIVNNNKSV